MRVTVFPSYKNFNVTHKIQVLSAKALKTGKKTKNLDNIIYLNKSHREFLIIIIIKHIKIFFCNLLIKINKIVFLIIFFKELIDAKVHLIIY